MKYNKNHSFKKLINELNLKNERQSIIQHSIDIKKPVYVEKYEIYESKMNAL